MQAPDQRVLDIIGRAWEGAAPTQEECAYLLGLPADSAEACAVRGAADGIMRQRTGNAAVLFAQIGYSCPPCPANCSFCLFFTTTIFRISRLISFGFHRFAKAPHPFFANCPTFPS